MGHLDKGLKGSTVVGLVPGPARRSIRMLSWREVAPVGDHHLSESKSPELFSFSQVCYTDK